ncbi:MAG: type II secretion system F family protein [Acidobacteria bacterium]|nr:type II secretion system F family protein [Acidobacteriota bacterium]
MRRLRGAPARATLGALAGFALAGFALAGLPGAALGGAGGAVWPAYARRRAERARPGLIEAELPDALATMAAVLRAGHSLPQALLAARDAARPPLRGVLHEAVRRQEVGGSLDEAIEALQAGCPAGAGRLVGLALRVGRVSSGEIARVLEGVAATLVDRARTAAERRAATAEARLSAAVVAGMPPVFFLLVGARSSEVTAVLFGTPAGWAALGLGVALEVVGILWVRRLVGER